MYIYEGRTIMLTIKRDDEGRLHYYDNTGVEIREGDTVMLAGMESPKKVFLIEDDELGVDATNPVWLLKGRACPAEYGIYPFEEGEYVMVVGDREYTGVHHIGEIVEHHGHECRVTHCFSEDGKNGIAIIPTGNYGFEISIYDEQL